MRSVRAVALSMPLLGALLDCSAARPAPAPTPVSSGVAAASTASAPRADRTLLSRRVLFGSPDRAQVKISPDGHRIGYLAPLQGVETLFVGAVDDIKKAQSVGQDTKAPPVAQETKTQDAQAPRAIPDAVGDVRSWWWSFDSGRIVFARDKGGENQAHLYVVDLAKSETRDLTPSDGLRAQLLALSPKRPHDALIAVRARDKSVSDVYSIDLTTGARKLVL